MLSLDQETSIADQKNSKGETGPGLESLQGILLSGFMLSAPVFSYLDTSASTAIWGYLEGILWPLPGISGVWDKG